MYRKYLAVAGAVQAQGRARASPGPAADLVFRMYTLKQLQGDRACEGYIGKYGVNLIKYN